MKFANVVPWAQGPNVSSFTFRAVGILREALAADDEIDRRGTHRLHGRYGWRIVLEDRGDQAHLRLAREHLWSSRHLVDDGPEREDVGPRVGVLASSCSGAMY